jgi:hypothetical protein
LLSKETLFYINCGADESFIKEISKEFKGGNQVDFEPTPIGFYRGISDRNVMNCIRHYYTGIISTKNLLLKVLNTIVESPRDLPYGDIILHTFIG